MHRLSTAVAAATSGLLLAACGTNTHANPPGLTDHMPGNTADAPANQAGGSCLRLTSTRIQAVFGGQVSSPQADNLTPGLDRCNWTINHSPLSQKPLELTAYRPTVAGPATGRGQHRPAVRVPDLGAGATFTPTTLTLTYTRSSVSVSLQLIPSGTMAHSRQAAVLGALVQLARN